MVAIAWALFDTSRAWPSTRRPCRPRLVARPAGSAEHPMKAGIISDRRSYICITYIFDCIKFLVKFVLDAITNDDAKT